MNYNYNGEATLRSKRRIIADALADRIGALDQAYRELRERDNRAGSLAQAKTVETAALPIVLQEAVREQNEAVQAERDARKRVQDSERSIRSLAKETGHEVFINITGQVTFYKVPQQVQDFGKDHRGLSILTQEAKTAFDKLMAANKEADNIELSVAVGIKNVGDFQLLLESIQRMGEK